MPRRRAAVPAMAALFACMSCADPYDYSAYRAHMPRSILVLPPLNESVEAIAPYTYLSTVTRPLAERGYYVFPVSVIDEFMKSNGLPTPGEMQTVSLAKLGEIIGPDAVLYVTIEEWGQKYVVLSSNTVVHLRGQLVDVDTGTLLWEGTAKAVQSSGGSGNLIADLVIAVVEQIVDTIRDATHGVSRQANQLMVYKSKQGLLVGPLHPKFGVTDEE